MFVNWCEQGRYFFQSITIFDNPIEYVDPLAFDGILELKSLNFQRALRYVPDFSKTANSLRYLFISRLEGENKYIDLKPLIMLEVLRFQSSGLNEIPRSIRHVSSTIHYLDLVDNCITTLENMENIVFRNLTTIYLMQNHICHVNHISLQLPVLSSISLSENQLTHLGDMSTCQWGMAKRRSGFVTIRLEHNPWHCNGSMLWLQSSLCYDAARMSASYIRQPQGLIIDISRLMCNSPVEFRGKALIPLNESEVNKLDICSKGEF